MQIRLAHSAYHTPQAGVNQGRRRPVTGHEVVRGTVVVCFRGGHTAHQGQAMHRRGDPWQNFAHLNSRATGVDRLELAPNLSAGVWLGIPCIDVRWAARQPDQDAGIGPGGNGKAFDPLALNAAHSQETCQVKTQCAQDPRPEQRPPGNAAGIGEA